MILEEDLLVGIVQTTLDCEAAWPHSASIPQMSAQEDARAWQEIQKAMRAFQDGERQPRMVILPELAIPRTRLDDFERIVAALNVVAFVGVDFLLDFSTRVASNEGLIFIPMGFFQNRPSRRCVRVKFGKSFGAPEELSLFANLAPPWTFSGDHNVYVIDAESLGLIGLAICYDFMDIERALMYRGRIHHLFVISYNMDLTIFQALATALSRTIFCNVVIVNTGFYGGSLVVSPYSEAHRRTIYAHSGQTLFTTQVVKLPVLGLDLSKQGKGRTFSVSADRDSNEFKAPPPGI